MSSVILKDYTTLVEYDVVLTDSITPQITSGVTAITLPVNGNKTIIKGDATADEVTISPATGWTFADGSSTVVLTVQFESVSFACDANTQTYYEIG